MSPEHTENGASEIRQQDILNQAEERYGIDAYFVYLRGEKLFTMTLPDAMKICGQHMAGAKPEELWAVLDKWHEAAVKLEAKSETVFAKSLELGRAALESRGIGVENADRGVRQ
ncbi:MAG: hypothetical protein WAQ27_04805 [Candidatus Microsaccharimonas sp.]